MNGENLAEYAALLASEGLLGHQHANSGWGTFDDDNMVGATAVHGDDRARRRASRAGYGDNGERLGFDLYPYTEDAVGAVKRSVAALELIEGLARKIDGPALARPSRRRTPSAPTSSSTPRSALTNGEPGRPVGLDVGTTGVKAVAVSPDGRILASASEEYALSTPQPGWAEQDPEDWWRAAEACLHACRGPIGLSGQMHGLVVLDAEDRVLRPAIALERPADEAECAEIEARVGLERLIELTGNRRSPGFTAPKLLWLRRHEPDT